MNKLPDNFNWNNYLLLNTDLTFTTEEQCNNHYLRYGINEDRIYILDIPDDFDWKIYLEINPDLAINCGDNYNAINHYIKYGRNENRQYKKESFNLKDKFRKNMF